MPHIVRLTALVVLSLVLLLAASPTTVGAASGGTCGTLRTLHWPNALTQSHGLATVADQTFRLNLPSWSDGTSTIGRSVAVGSEVCLTGDVPDTTGLITNFTLDGCTTCASGIAGSAIGGLPSWAPWPVALLGLGGLACAAAARGAKPVRRPPPPLRIGAVGLRMRRG